MISDKNTPRILGFMFVLVIVTNILGSMQLGSLNVEIVGPPENISEIMMNISNNPTAMHLSIIAYLFEACEIALLSVLLYTVLKKQDNVIAHWAFGLWIGEAIFVAIKQIGSFSLLYVSQEFVKAGAPVSSHYQTLGGLFYELMQFIYDGQMVFYTVGGVLFYYLFLKSKSIPAAISIFGILAASLGFVGEMFTILGYNIPLIVFLPILPFELAIGIWLMVKGINSSAINSPSS